MAAGKKAKRHIRQFEKASAKDLRKDKKETARVIDAAFESVSTAHKGGKKRLNRYNRGRIEKVLAMQDRMGKAGRRDVERVASRVDRFGDMGGMLSQSYRKSTKNAQAGAKTGRATVEAGRKLVESVDETSRTALGIAEAGAREAEAGAEAALHDSVGVRAQADAARAAEMRFQLAQTRLQHQLAIKQMEKQAEIDRKNLEIQQKAAQSTLGGSFAGIKAAASQLSTIGNDILRMVKAGEDDTAILQAISTNYQITAPQDLAAVNRLIQLLGKDRSGVTGREEMIADITEVIESVPGWGKLGGKKKNVIYDLVKAFADYDGVQKDINDAKDAEGDDEEYFLGGGGKFRNLGGGGGGFPDLTW